MSIQTIVVWIGAVLAFIAGLIALLPSGDRYPFPEQVATGTETLYTWLYTFNSIFPVDTLIQVVMLAIVVEVVTRFVWPSLIWIFESVTGVNR